MTTARTVVDVVADGLVRHGVTFILGQSVPTALVLACEDRGIRNITYRQENMGGAIADEFLNSGCYYGCRRCRMGGYERRAPISFRSTPELQ